MSCHPAMWPDDMFNEVFVKPFLKEENMSKSPWYSTENFSDDVHHDRSAEHTASEEIDLTEAADSYLEGYEEAQSEAMIYIDGYKAGLLEGLQENSRDAFEEGLGAAARDIELTQEQAEAVVRRFYDEDWFVSGISFPIRIAKLLVLVTGGNRHHGNVAGMYDPKDIEDAK